MISDWKTSAASFASALGLKRTATAKRKRLIAFTKGQAAILAFARALRDMTAICRRCTASFPITWHPWYATRQTVFANSRCDDGERAWFRLHYQHPQHQEPTLAAMAWAND